MSILDIHTRRFTLRIGGTPYKRGFIYRGWYQWILCTPWFVMGRGYYF
jgi:hypothetical protein